MKKALNFLFIIFLPINLINLIYSSDPSPYTAPYPLAPYNELYERTMLKLNRLRAGDKRHRYRNLPELFAIRDFHTSMKDRDFKIEGRSLEILKELVGLDNKVLESICEAFKRQDMLIRKRFFIEE